MFIIGNIARRCEKRVSLPVWLPCLKGAKEGYAEMKVLIEKLDEQMRAQGRPESFTLGYKTPSSREEWERWCNDESVHPLAAVIEWRGVRTEYDAPTESELIEKLTVAGWL